ncbi:MAG: DNA repair protein RadC, partial [Bacteroidota bacterium]
KLLDKGRQSLSDAELIAILFGTGNTEQTAVELAKTILSYADNNLNELGKIAVSDLCRFKGVGEVKAITVIAALELGRRRSQSAPKEKPTVISSNDAFKELSPVLSDLNHEEFWVLLLNRSNKLKERILISKGGLTGTIVDLRIIFKTAIHALATGIVLAHNHPSGNLKPSQQDLDLTKKLVTASRLLDIQIMDHLIVAGTQYYSFADNGKI